MSGTVKTQASLLAGVPTGGPAGGILPGNIEDIIATMSSLTQGALTPEMYGAKGNGTTDDSAAFNSCFAAALTAGAPVVFGAKTYALANPIHVGTAGGTAEQNPIPRISGAGFGDGVGIGTVLKAITGLTGTVFTAQNVVEMILQDFVIECNNIAATGLDTTWQVTGQTGPSVNNIYENIQIRNYTSVGWIAGENNDCSFNHILMDSPSNTTANALRIIAPNGSLMFSDCVFQQLHPNCGVIINSQDAYFINCNMTGITIPSGSQNSHTSFHGGYIYSPSNTGITFNIQSGAVVTSIGLFGTHVENNTAWNSGTGAGCIFGGTGALWAGGVLMQPDINITVGGTPCKLVSTALGTGYGASQKARIIVMGGEESNNPVDWSSTSNFDVCTMNVWRNSTGLPIPDNWVFKGLPTSASGLPTGAIWNSSGALHIV